MIMPNEIKYPYLAYSEITGCVYIVLDKRGNKIDVTSQYEFIVKEREKTTNNTNFIPTCPVPTEICPW